MRFAILSVLLLVACSRQAAFPYPEEAKAKFQRTCSGGEDFCACAWDGVTHAMTKEDYEAAQTRLDVEGIIDPRLVRVRVHCREQAI